MKEKERYGGMREVKEDGRRRIKRKVKYLVKVSKDDEGKGEV